MPQQEFNEMTIEILNTNHVYERIIIILSLLDYNIMYLILLIQSTNPDYKHEM